MGYVMNEAAQGRLGAFLELIGRALGEKRRKASFAMYAYGLFSDGERKSMEPIAARACGAEATADSFHQRLGHFITDSDWSDRNVRRVAASYGIAEMVKHGPIGAWIIDDTGFEKQGTHSVGVQRQYTGTAGKVTNCQIGVSLSVSTRTEHLPIDFELYLPKSWTDEALRRKEAKIPEEIGFATKPELALKMIDRAVENGVPRGVVLADAAYGNSDGFRSRVRERGLDYAVAVNSSTTVWVLDEANGRGRIKWTVKDVATVLGPKRFRRTTWREGTGERLTAKFAARRVVVGHDDGPPPAQREEQWLLMEWRDGEAEAAHFYLLTLPRGTRRKAMVRLVKERYRTERAYEDLKGELGLDHFEGRRYRGWHHHVSVALTCYAFITAEKVRAFPPSEGWASATSSLGAEAGATLRRLVHHHPPRDRPSPFDVAPPVPHVPEAIDALSIISGTAPLGLTQ